MITSDITDNLVYKDTRSAFNMIDFFASWFGIRTNLTKDDYDIFKEERQGKSLNRQAD